jgi:hypothetical protein
MTERRRLTVVKLELNWIDASNWTERVIVPGGFVRATCIDGETETTLTRPFGSHPELGSTVVVEINREDPHVA